MCAASASTGSISITPTSIRRRRTCPMDRQPIYSSIRRGRPGASRSLPCRSSAGRRSETGAPLEPPGPCMARNSRPNARTGGATWCSGRGNGCIQTEPIAALPTRTSQLIDATFVTDWRRTSRRVGDAGHGGVRLFALDNEPGLWNSSHRDVHRATTYRSSGTRRSSRPREDEGPGRLLLRAGIWGWCGVFFSAPTVVMSSR